MAKREVTRPEQAGSGRPEQRWWKQRDWVITFVSILASGLLSFGCAHYQQWLATATARAQETPPGQPRPGVDDVRAIEERIAQEPKLAGAGPEAIASYFRKDAVVRDVWHYLAGDRGESWSGIDRIVERYGKAELQAHQASAHANVEVIEIAPRPDGFWALCTSMGYDGQKPTNPELWVLHKTGSTWYFACFYYDIPPKKYAEVLRSVRHQYGFT
jgi:hypothetical protein